MIGFAAFNSHLLVELRNLRDGGLALPQSHQETLALTAREFFQTGVSGGSGRSNLSTARPLDADRSAIRRNVSLCRVIVENLFNSGGFC